MNAHELHVWSGDRPVATITHNARDDQWAIAYKQAWRASTEAFALSPHLPIAPPNAGYASGTIKRFIEHLLPEGRALDAAVAYNGLTKSNVFSLIRALGAETAGALRFTAQATTTESKTRDDIGPVLREIPRQELHERIAQHAQTPLTFWDGKVRMSVAGLQDKLLVYIDRPLEDDGRMYLVDGERLASTHILKPDTGENRTPHLAVNEHFCMSLARRMGLPAAQVSLLRTPSPVLVVRRFDRELQTGPEGARVQRWHVIDACQACDLPISYKYERNFGSAPDVRGIRDGMSFERLFQCTELTGNKATAKLTLLRWALFQFLIGNSDAHGKNFSFFMRPGGLLEPADWYDLVSVLQYQGFDTELAMAYGDVFDHAQVTAFALADFATRCGVDRKLMRREGQRMAKLATMAAPQCAQSADYLTDEQPFVERIAVFVTAQAQRLSTLVGDAAAVKASYL